MARALAILLLAGLGGCVYDPHRDFSDDFGDSVRTNIAAQVVNPVPLQPLPTAPTNGYRLDRAYDRYQNNRVFRPVPAPSLQTPTGGGAGGGAAGGGSSDSSASGGGTNSN